MLVFMFLVMLLFSLIGNVSAQDEGGNSDDDDDDNEWEDYGPIEIMGIGIIVVLLMIVVVYIGLWIYRDANSRGLDGAQWLIIMFVGNIIGLIIYYFIRKENPVLKSTPTGRPSQPIMNEETQETE